MTNLDILNSSNSILEVRRSLAYARYDTSCLRVARDYADLDDLAWWEGFRERRDRGLTSLFYKNEGYAAADVALPGLSNRHDSLQIVVELNLQALF